MRPGDSMDMARRRALRQTLTASAKWAKPAPKKASSMPDGFDRATSAPKNSAASKASKRANLNLDALRAKGNAATQKAHPSSKKPSPVHVGKGADPATAPKKPTPKGGGGVTTPPPSGGGGAGGGKKAPAKKDPKKAATSSTSATDTTLSGYLKQAQTALGPGTDYSKLRGQVQADTGTADSNIAAMYAALDRDIRGQNDTIKQGYDDAEADQQRFAADAVKTSNDGYNSSAQQLTDRMSALGIGDAAKSLAAAGGNAQADQARATSSIAQRLQNTLTNTTRNGAAATNFNAQTGNAAQVGGVQQRAGLQGQLQDQLAKISTNESSEAADRRDKALSYALQQRSSDQSAQAATAAAELDAKKLAFDQSYKSGQLELGQRKASITENHNAATDTQAALNASNDVAAKQDRARQASSNYQLELTKLKAQNANSKLNRQNAARTAAIQAGMTSEEVKQAVKAVK